MTGKSPKFHDGFNFALFLTPPHKPTNPDEQDRERVQMELNLDTASSYNDIDRVSKNSKLKNFLSKDLMKKLESFSPTKSIMSGVSSQVLQLQLNEIDSEGKKVEDFSDLISPINIRDNKNFKINTHDFNEKGEKSIINLISPANEDKQAFDFSKNNFLPRKNSNKTNESKNEIKINYYANNINISNNNNFFNNMNVEQQKSSITENNYEFKTSHNQNQFIYGSNMSNMSFNNNYPYQGNGNQYQPPFNNGYSQQFPPGNFPQYQQMPNNVMYRDLQPNTIPKMGEKKKRQFAERQGDWVCMKCKNLNFSFRVVCNRCQLPKGDSDLLYLEHMNNLKNLNRQNDMLQNQIFNQGMSMGNSFNSNMFSPNPLCNPNTVYGGNLSFNL